MPFDELIFPKGHPPCDDRRIFVAKILSQEHRTLIVGVSFSSAVELSQQNDCIGREPYNNL